jgi:hypothetical protein
VSKIVCPNSDWESLKRWLVREAILEPEFAESFFSVIATGVRFGPAPVVEEGFGGTVIAFCDTAVGTDRSFEKAPDGKRLHFLGSSFYDEDNNVVVSCPRLILNSDGFMYAYGL